MDNYPNFYITTKELFNSLKAADKISIKCQFCFNVFESTKKRILSQYRYYNTVLQFCSAKCSVGHRSLNKSKFVKCTECNADIRKTISELSKSDNHFCSQSCSASHSNRKRHLKKLLNDPDKLANAIQRISQCINCNKPFTKTRQTQKCCSVLCNMEHRSKNTYANSVCKRIGANKYDSIRKSARNYSIKILPHKCANCGYDKHFETCHIKAIKNFDLSNTTLYEINNKDNLIHLCPNCHWEFDNNLLTLDEIKKRL